MGKIVFFSGLPKSGKSVTLGALYDALRAKGTSFFLERVCPDCEGIWTLQSENGSDRAREHKNRLKNAGEFFSPAFVESKCRSLSGLARHFDTVLADMGGIPSPENAQIVQSGQKATAEVQAAVLHLQGTDPAPWVQWWLDRGVTPTVKETVNPWEDRFNNAQDLMGVV